MVIVNYSLIGLFILVSPELKGIYSLGVSFYFEQPD